jgi:hypothetical protein
MQSTEFARYARELGRISVAIRPGDRDPARETATLARFHLLSAIHQLERARDHMTMLEKAGETRAPGEAP